MFDVEQKTEKYMSLVVTHECNKKCSFCIDDYRGSGEFMSMNTLRNSLSVASRNAVEDILIVGGEPTLHPRIIEIVKEVKRQGFRVIMTTNYSMPEIVKKLDGLVDCFNISYYKQKELPAQNDMISDLTIHALIHAKQLNTREKLDNFIEKYKGKAHLKFSTLSPCNNWAKKNQIGAYLNDLNCEWVVLFNEMLGQIYRGCVVKRYDRVLTKTATQSLKAHVDGEISFSWQRTSNLTYVT